MWHQIGLMPLARSTPTKEPGCRKAAGLLLFVEVLELIGWANMRCLLQGGVDDNARNAKDR